MNHFATMTDKSSFELDISGAFIRRTDLSNANLARANLSGADCTGVSFRGANFKDAKLDGTILVGADLTGAKNLTVDQVRSAIFDESTILPDYLIGKV